MKFIDATDYSLGSFGSPTRLDILTLEAYMLAPSDEVVRQKIRTTTGIEFANRHLDLLPSDFFRDFIDLVIMNYRTHGRLKNDQE